MNPVFLALGEILEIHQDQIARYGGASGIRDIGLLQSAIAMPSSSFGGQFLHSDLFEMAAAYLLHISQNHPFVDWNKRTGAVAAIVFLALNDIELDADEDGFEKIVLQVAEGKAGKETVATFLRDNSIS